jgi:hypothetical protein
MNIELLIRMEDSYTDEEYKELQELLVSERAIYGDDFREDDFWAANVKYTYLPLVLPIESIIPFSKYDSDHTIIRFTEESFVAKIRYSRLKSIFTSITGETIRTESDFKFDEPKGKA